jgi:hypothetical protein
MLAPSAYDLARPYQYAEIFAVRRPPPDHIQPALWSALAADCVVIGLCLAITIAAT